MSDARTTINITGEAKYSINMANLGNCSFSCQIITINRINQFSDSVIFLATYLYFFCSNIYVKPWKNHFKSIAIHFLVTFDTKLWYKNLIFTHLSIFCTLSFPPTLLSVWFVIPHTYFLKNILHFHFTRKATRSFSQLVTISDETSNSVSYVVSIIVLSYVPCTHVTSNTASNTVLAFDLQAVNIYT